MNRRAAIGRFAALGAAAYSSGYFTSAEEKPSLSANSKLQILCVGTANRAAADVQGVRGERIVGLCDVDSAYLNKAATEFPDAKLFRDYREMIAEMSDSADAIVIGTTDHHHAPAAIRAIDAGMHCYCEKPLSHTVAEARIVTEAARKRGVATQMGTQIHAGANYRRVVEVVQSGAIGDVSRVHVWVGKQWGGGERPDQTDPVPDSLDWDLWLGPAPERPYAKGRYHPGQWRRWWDFGQGTLGDMACHYMDLPFWALELKHCTDVTAHGFDKQGPVTAHAETCPTGMVVDYQFPSRGDLPPVKLTWYDGHQTPKEIEGLPLKNSGVMFVGSEGKMIADYGSYQLYPESKFADFTPPAQTIAPSIGHHAEWIQACKDGSPTTCNFDYSGALTEAVLLGNVAYRVGKPLQWDAARLQATNCPEADQYIRKSYRHGWEVLPI